MAEKHPKRPRDLNQWAKRMVEIGTGQVEDRQPTPEEQGKDPAAAALGRKGGMSRAKKLSDARRKDIAKKAAASRWKTSRD
jgi:hypothetical protein